VKTSENSAEGENREPETWVNVVRNQLRTLKFGVVQIVVHDGQVVQIERTEKLRLDKSQQ
jgi:hypothetical protein